METDNSCENIFANSYDENKSNANENENERISNDENIENSPYDENSSLEDDSSSDSDSEDESAPQPITLNSRSYKPKCNFIEKYNFPVLVEDTGKNHTNQESLSDYEFDLNRIFTLNQVGKVRATRRVAPGKYLIDCQSRPQRQSLITKASLRTPLGGYIAIQCKIPQPVTEGVIGPISPSVDIQSIKEKIEEHNANFPNNKISKFCRVQRYDRDENMTVDTAFVKLTFESHTLPSSIYLGTTLYGVDTFRREPILCGKCHLLGHTKNRCRSKETLCGKCLQERHPCGEKECPLPKSEWSCRNCKTKGHSASWPRCPKKLIMRKALEIQSSTYMPLASAVAIVTGEKDSLPEKKSKKLKSSGKAYMQGSKMKDYPPLAPNRVRHLNITPTNLTEPSPELLSLGDQDSGRRGSLDTRSQNPSKKETETSSTPSNKPNISPVGIQSLAEATHDSYPANPNFQLLLESINRNNENMQKRFETFQKETNKKLTDIVHRVDTIQKQKEEQLKLVENFVKANKQKANATEKVVLDIVDVIRKAANGEPNSLFDLAKKLSGSSQDVGDNLKLDISVLTQNINF